MKKSFLLIFFVTFQAMALMLGHIPPEVVLQGKDGGRVDGSPWHSTMLHDKVYVLFYVDPDERNTNEAFSEALKEKNFPHDKYTSVAIVNMAATWMPNFAIEAKLKAKQEKYPNAIYVKDKRKVLVKKWALKDNSSDILIFDKSGKLLFQHAGKLCDEQIHKVLDLIESHLDR